MARASASIDTLVETAMTLFHQRGFHATGIGAIIKEAGISKMTLYSWFRSKDELVLAALRKRDERFRNWFMKEIEARAKDPRGRLLSIPAVVAKWIASPNFCGCMFINAAAEFSDHKNPVHVAAAEHKRLILLYIRGLSGFAGARDPDLLAKQIFLVAEGMIVDAQVSGTDGSLAAASETVSLIVAHGLDGSSEPATSAA